MPSAAPFNRPATWLTSVPMRFNRCIIFDSRQFHARTGAFGSTAQDGRLTQNFFFDILQ